MLYPDGGCTLSITLHRISMEVGIAETTVADIAAEGKKIIIITQTAAIALEPLTTHPDEWAEPSHK